MSSKVLIIIESGKKGSNECNFLKTFLKKNIKKDIDEFVNFYPINGWTNLTENAIEKNIRKNQLKEKKTIFNYIKLLNKQSPEERIAARIDKFSSMGSFA